MNDACIRVQDVSIRYEGNVVLEDISFECHSGEFVAIVGKSGTGKTSLLNAMAGFIPYHGTLTRPQGIGYVFQDHAVFPWMTVEKNVAFGLDGLSRAERDRRVIEILERVEIAHLGSRYPSELSGGQVQRVALARSLAPDPPVLLMDEPYASLDHHTRDAMQEWLLSVWTRDRKTILFVTHYIEEAIYLADRILVLDQHRLASDVKVPFSRPRTDVLRFSQDFLDLKHRILTVMSNGRTSLASHESPQAGSAA